MENESSSIIRVVGEEDLSPLLLHPMAPIGSVVIYGQPGKGLVISGVTKNQDQMQKYPQRFFHRLVFSISNPMKAQTN